MNLSKAYSNYSNNELVRLSFWTKRIDVRDISTLTNGDIVLDATQPLNMDDRLNSYDVFIFARFPCIYILGGEIENGSSVFRSIPSSLLSHTELVKF